MSIDIEVLPVGPLQANCYLLKHRQDRTAIVVDPGGEPERIIARLAGFRIDRIVLTHAHYDHIGGLDAVRRATGAPAFLHEAEHHWLSDPQSNGSAKYAMFGGSVTCAPADGALRGGDTIALGNEQITVRETPGHSPGSVSFVGPGWVICGDTLFRRSIGRTDLVGGNYQQLLTSIQRELLSLPDDTIVLPGHGPATTIGEERETNPFL